MTKTISASIYNSAKISVASKIARLIDLKPGDNVLLVYDDEEPKIFKVRKLTDKDLDKIL